MNSLTYFDWLLAVFPFGGEGAASTALATEE